MSEVDHVLSSLLTQPPESAKQILSSNQSTADRKRRREKKERQKVRTAVKEKRLLADLDHIKPDFSTAEFEKGLTKIATKGVVTLFNAVAKQQKQMETIAAESAEADTKAKKSKVESNVKDNFLKLLKNESSKVGGIVKGKDGKDASGKWSVLNDDFGMKGNKMKDWDKESESDEAEGGNAMSDEDDE